MRTSARQHGRASFFPIVFPDNSPARSSLSSARPLIRSSARLYICPRVRPSARSLVRVTARSFTRRVRSSVFLSARASPRSLVRPSATRLAVRACVRPHVRSFARLRSFALPSDRLARPLARPLVCLLVRLSARTHVSSRLSSRSFVRPSARSRVCPSFVAPLVNLGVHAAARSRVCPSNIARIRQILVPSYSKEVENVTTFYLVRLLRSAAWEQQLVCPQMILLGIYRLAVDS